MSLQVVIRRETKNKWEGRAPLTPSSVARLTARDIPISVEKSIKRVYSDDQYRSAGAVLVDDSRNADVVIGIKEPQIQTIKAGQIHLAFSHTIKGQAYNMPLLRRFLEKKASLIDYEPIKNRNGVRLIAFGRYAGIAGAVDSFYVAGQKLADRNRTTGFGKIKQTHHYRTIRSLKKALAAVHPEQHDPVRVLIVGTGNVGKGTVEVCDWLGLKRIEPEELRGNKAGPGTWYCVLGTEDIVRSKNGEPYDRENYRLHGSERFESSFTDYLGKFDILLQTPYWEKKYPRQLTRDQMLQFRERLPIVVGDISCDIEGSLACTLRASTIDEPAYTYDPDEHRAINGVSWQGPTVMAIDHLPCELSVDASEHFSKALSRFVPELSAVDLTHPLENCGLSRALLDATIVYQGELTPSYRYLNRYL